MGYEALIAETILMRGHEGDQIQFHTYDNAGHAFFAVDRPQYRQHPAVDGWTRVLAWLGKHLQ